MRIVTTVRALVMAVDACVFACATALADDRVLIAKSSYVERADESSVLRTRAASSTHHFSFRNCCATARAVSGR